MKTFFWPILVIIAGTIFASWFNRERYDVRYTLTENVPVSFGGATSEAVQQIEVQNLGKSRADRIQVRVQSAVIAHQVIRQSAADNVVEFKTADSLEIVYPSLPADGSFRLVFKTYGDGVPKERVQVRHEKGIATYAFGSSSPWSSVVTWVQVLSSIIYCLLLFGSLREQRVSSLKHKAEYESEELLRKKHKPWGVNDEQWREVRQLALKKFATQSIGSDVGDIETSATFRRLNQDRLEFLSSDESQEYRVLACEQVLLELSVRIHRQHSYERLRSLLRLKRPLQLPEDKWDEIASFLVGKVLEKRVQDSRHREELPYLEEERPEQIGKKEWEACQKEFVDRLYFRLIKEIEWSRSPLSIVDTAAAGALPTKESEELKKRAYAAAVRLLPDVTIPYKAASFLATSRPAWILDDDYDRYKEMAERVVENDSLKLVLRDISNGLRPSDESMDALSSELRGKIAEMESKLRGERQRVAEESRKLLEERAEFASERKIVIKQLNILNALFDDPKSISRIEAYDNPFASGNFESLKFVANVLQSADPPARGH